MIKPQEIERMFRLEFGYLASNIIWQTDDGSYEVFAYYKIMPENKVYRVFCSATDVGVFSSTRTALSWCIADKYKSYNLARELLEVDTKLLLLTSDLAVRTAIAERSKCVNFRESVALKLETKIIHKKQLENQLSKYVNCAKYFQQQGFANETARTGRGQPNKTSRSSI
jgi:hypothetical protein